MANSRMTKKELGLLKGAIRRVFSRSDLRRKVLDTADVVHSDSSRPRVRKWSRCPVCTKLNPKYKMVVDHIVPVIPTDSSFDVMSVDVVIDRMWCEENNLQPICPDCHDKKTKEERKQRTAHRKIKKGKKRR